MASKKKLSVVISALNEEPRIGNVLSIVCDHPLVSEVIVINDGSEDDTSKVAKNFGAKVIDHPQRKGKTSSVYEGIGYVKTKYLMLLDADLKGLSSEYINQLAEPVLSGKVDFTMSLRANSLNLFKWLGIEFVSGERVMRKELLSDEYIWAKRNINFSLEVRMNRSFLKKKLKFVSVKLPELTHSIKYQKQGFLKGIMGDARMIWQINKALPLPLVIYQLLKMAYLNKKYQKEVYGP